mgnify:CR=1 FL=1
MDIFAMYLIFSMLAVIYFDVTRYTIPNWLCGSLILLYPIAIWMAPGTVDWQMALVAMLVVFAVGYVVFSRGWMGGGDIKLMTACALWVGWHSLLSFVFLVAIFGGVLSVVLVVGRKVYPFIPKLRDKKPPRIFQKDGPVPYGLAIAAGFLVYIWTGKIALLFMG